MLINRRNFLSAAGLTAPTFLLPTLSLLAKSSGVVKNKEEDKRVYFFLDGPMFQPTEYIARLQGFNQQNEIQCDRYGQGGVVSAFKDAIIDSGR
jgi:hypothetical protein